MSTRLLAGLPTPLAHGLRVATSSLGTDLDRLSRRLTFAEGVLRFLVAVQDAERSALDLPRPRPVLELLGRLDRPTFGMWAQAALSLSARLRGVPGRPLGELVPGLCHSGRVDSVGAAINALIDLRNEIAHGERFLELPPARAAQLLGECTDPFRALLLSLDGLCALNLVVETAGWELPDERWAARVVVLRGTAPRGVEVVSDERVFPSRQPVLVGDEGRVVRLGPWMVLHQDSGLPQVLVLDRSDREGPRYSEPCGPRLAAVTPGLDGVGFASDRVAWFDRYLKSRRTRHVPPAIHSELGPVLSSEAPPRVRRCRPLRLLGRGGTGAVWLVEDDDRGGERLALKVLHPALAAHPDHLARLGNEFDVLAGLQVPGVVRVLDFFLDPREGPCLLMEWVDGQSLAAVVRDGPLPPERAALVVRSLLHTLGVVHARGVVHRDIKPSNVLLVGDEPRLVDFGVARTADGQTLTATADIVGTLAYAAPEQLRGRRSGPPADLYGVGRVLRDLLVGIEPEEHALAELPGGLQQVLRKALREEPGQRYQTAGEMDAALVAALAGEFHGCAVDIGEVLPGGLCVTEVGSELIPGIFLVEARTPSGQGAALLAPGPESGARGAFYAVFESLDPALRRQHGCLRVAVTGDGIPYVELFPDDAEQRGRALLSARPPGVAPVAEPAYAPLREGAAPSKPPSGALAGSMAASALGTVLGVATGSPMLGRATSGALGAAFRALGGGAQARPASSDPLESSHHLGLALLGLEAACQGLAVSESNWRKAWGSRLGGWLMLVRLHDRSGGPISAQLRTRTDLDATRQAAEELSRARGRLSPAAAGRLAELRAVMVMVLRAASAEVSRLALPRAAYARVVDGALQVRGVRSGQWVIVELEPDPPASIG